jgi:hypothetical protein
MDPLLPGAFAEAQERRGSAAKAARNWYFGRRDLKNDMGFSDDF